MWGPSLGLRAVTGLVPPPSALGQFALGLLPALIWWTCWTFYARSEKPARGKLLTPARGLVFWFAILLPFVGRVAWVNFFAF
jgi:hypothetical protein